MQRHRVALAIADVERQARHDVVVRCATAVAHAIARCERAGILGQPSDWRRRSGSHCHRLRQRQRGFGGRIAVATFVNDRRALGWFCRRQQALERSRRTLGRIVGLRPRRLWLLFCRWLVRLLRHLRFDSLARLTGRTLRLRLLLALFIGRRTGRRLALRSRIQPQTPAQNLGGSLRWILWRLRLLRLRRFAGRLPLRLLGRQVTTQQPAAEQQQLEQRRCARSQRRSHHSTLQPERIEYRRILFVFAEHNVTAVARAIANRDTIGVARRPNTARPAGERCWPSWQRKQP